MDSNDPKSRAIKARPDLPIQEVLDVLTDSYNGLGTVYSPADVVGRLSAIAPDVVLTTLSVLSDEPFGLLKSAWIFLDKNDQRIDVSSDDVSEALASGEFYHPDSGEPVPDFKDVIGLLYESTQELSQLVGAQKKNLQTVQASKSRTTPVRKIISLVYGAFEDDRDYALHFLRDLVEVSVPRMEEGANNLGELGEDGLSDMLIAPMVVPYPGLTREANSVGHVDIILKQPSLPNPVLKGEAKEIGGVRQKSFVWYSEGLTKLVAKYNRGRESFALMLCYCRATDMYTLMPDYERKIKEQSVADYIGPADLAEYQFEDLRGIFLTRHKSNGRPIVVAHVWVNLHYETDDQLMRREKEARKKKAPPA